MIKRIFFSLFFLLTVSLVCLQLPFVQQKIQEALKETLKKSSIHFEVKHLSGILPFHFEVEELFIQTPELSLSIDHAKGKISLLRLLQKKLYLTDLVIEKIHYQDQNNASNSVEIPDASFGLLHFQCKHLQINEDTPFSIQGSYHQKQGKRAKFDGTLSFEKTTLSLHVKTAKDQVWGKGEGSLFFDNYSLDYQFQVSGPFFGPFEGIASAQDSLGHKINAKVGGTLFSWELTEASLKGGEGEGSGKAHLQLAPFSLSFDLALNLFEPKAKPDVKGFLDSEGFQVEVAGPFTIPKDPMSKNSWEGTATVHARWDEPIHFSQITAQSPFFNLEGDLTFKDSLEGVLHLKAPEFFNQGVDLYGVNADLLFENGGLNLTVQGQASAYKTVKTGPFETQLFFSSLETTAPTSFSFTLSAVETGDLSAENIQGSLRSDQQWNLVCHGIWREPFSLSLKGSASLQTEEPSFHFFSAEGAFFGEELHLNAPSRLLFTDTDWTLSATELLLGEGKAFLEKTEKMFALDLSSFPLHFFSLYDPTLRFEGKTHAHLQYQEGNTHLKAQIEEASLFPKKGVWGLSQIQGLVDFDQTKKGIKGKIDLRQEGKTWIQSHFEIPSKKEGFVEIDLDTPLEPLMDLINLGSNHIEGHLFGHLVLRGTIKNPSIEGTLHLENGSYENAYTGIDLQDITALFKGKGSQLSLTQFQGIDQTTKGTLLGKGSLDLHYHKKFPFQLDLNFDRLSATQLDLFSTELEGNLHLKGTYKKGSLSGNLLLNNAELSIPDHLPQSYPHLDVLFKGPPPSTSSFLTEEIIYPLSLDVKIEVPNTLHVGGRGVDATWKGAFHLKGPYPAFAIDGTLKLSEGSFAFSGKDFDLTQGKLYFVGKQKNTPYLELFASTHIDTLSIESSLVGPLKSPQVRLQSSPPLPLSSILSYLLFGEDISEINSYQALQLTGSLASLSSNQANILQNARKALGIDRLEITTSTQDTEDGKESTQVQVQVGKYLHKGVLVSIHQNAEETAPDISIEIELSKGFSIQLQTDQKREQGKFGLRWSRHY